jgi:membrane protein
MRCGTRVLLDAYAHFSSDNGWAFASHVALSTLTSLFPFLIFVTSVAGFLGSRDLAEAAVANLFAAWPKQVAEPLAREIHEVLTRGRGGVATAGAILAVYFASSGVEALRVALNRAYGVVDPRPWWLLRLESLAYVLIGAVALLTWAFLVVLAPLVSSILGGFAPGLVEAETLLTLGRHAIAGGVLLVALLVLHSFLPARRARLAEVLPGTALTFVLWYAAGVAFGSYLAQFAHNYVTTYAGLASVMIALVFLNLLAAIFVFGGELNAALLRARRATSRPAGESDAGIV